MKKEVKIGILVIVGTAMLIWGYNFLKGQNLFKNQAIYYVKFDNIHKLQNSSPVYINGFKVGNVKEIQIDPSNLQNIIVGLEILPEVRLPQDTEAQLYADGVMGDMAIQLTYSMVCKDNCIEPGSFIKGTTLSFLASFIQPDELDAYMTKIGSGLSTVMDTLNQVLRSPEFKDSEIGKMAESFKNTLQNLEAGTAGLNRMIETNSIAMKSMIENLHTITGGLADNQSSLNTTIQNVESITQTLAEEEGLKTTLANTNSAIEKLGDAGEETKKTLAGLAETTVKLNSVLSDINNGNGTLGKLITQDEVYTELQSSLRNLDLLLQDFRLNPKRYVNVSVFGKKSKDYIVPDDDPAVEMIDTIQY